MDLERDQLTFREKRGNPASPLPPVPLLILFSILLCPVLRQSLCGCGAGSKKSRQEWMPSVPKPELREHSSLFGGAVVR